MKTKAPILIVFVLVSAAIGYFALGLGRGRGDGSSGDVSGNRSGDAVEITMLYGTEKQGWIEDAAAAFHKQNPNIRVVLVGKGSLDGAQAILDGTQRPTLFSPADSLVLNLLANDWRVKNHAELVAVAGDDAPQPLVITPLVFAVWEDRALALRKAGNGAIAWKSIHRAVTSNQGWPAVGGEPGWGFVKLGHTDPTRSNSGLQVLWLMSVEYYQRDDLGVGDLLRPEYQEWVKGIEKGVTRYEPSTGTFMTDMVRFGPSKYDIAVVYENLAISQIENAQGRWGSLRVYYPSRTLWSDHPVALLQADWVTPRQRQAARQWITYLRSRPVQEKALAYGFRPADPSVAIRTAASDNPFVRLEQYGVRVDVPPVARVPDGAVVRNLMMMWSRVVGPGGGR